ncbi:MAG: AmmeMemoRadiSam system protein A [Syntrophorhabdaceae bacterium]|nr:AmmeMemoRadiSam system protein A [Syntrophorhabdaceae bacterium]
MSRKQTVFDEEERRELLRIARATLELRVREGKALYIAPPEGKLAKPGAAFVTLTKKEQLRGCVGCVEAVEPLYKVVQDYVIAAAFDDSRFPPLSADELALIKLNISVLSPLFPVRSEEVEVGLHGLLITYRQRRGLLLPHVPVKWGWDRETFLDNLCIKAGLQPGDWRRDVELKGFTAEVFGEE